MLSTGPTNIYNDAQHTAGVQQMSKEITSKPHKEHTNQTKDRYSSNYKEHQSKDCFGRSGYTPNRRSDDMCVGSRGASAGTSMTFFMMRQTKWIGLLKISWQYKLDHL